MPRPSVFLVPLIALTAAPAAARAQQLPTARPEEVGLSSDRLQRISRVMQQYVDSGRVPGVITLILRRGRVVHSGAFGWADRESRRRMAPDALFRIASQTKAITSVAAMMLIEEGRLTLNDPVSRFIPSFARTSVAVARDSTVPAKRAITVRDLLTHTAGISYGTDSLLLDRYRTAGLGPAAGDGWYLADKTEPVCATMERLGTLPFAAQPGERWVYGYGTDVLGCVVERASGQSLDAFFRQRIFEPLGMRDTRFCVLPDQRPRLVTVYAVTAEGRLERAPEGPRGQGEYLGGPCVNFSGGAGLVSTATDYARFLQMLLNGGELDGTRILGPKTVELMTVNHVGTLYSESDLGFGLGFQVMGALGRSGEYGSPRMFSWGGAYYTQYWVDPAEGLVALLMTQLLPHRAPGLADRFRALVYQAIVEEERRAAR